MYCVCQHTFHHAALIVVRFMRVLTHRVKDQRFIGRYIGMSVIAATIGKHS